MSSEQELRGGASPDGVVKVVKLLRCRPLDWPSCLRLGRVKFEKYFNHRVGYYLHVLDLVLLAVTVLFLCRLRSYWMLSPLIQR